MTKLAALIKDGLARTLFLDQCIVSGSNFVFSLVIIRMSGLAEYGTWVLLWTIYYLCNNLASAIVYGPMLAISPKLSENELTDYVSSTFILLATISALSFLVLLTGKAQIAGALVDGNPLDIWLMFTLAICSSLLFDYFRRLQMCLKNFKTLLAADTGFHLLRFAIIGSLALGSGSLNLDTIFLSIIVSSAAGVSFFCLATKFAPLDASVMKKHWSRHWSMYRWTAPVAVLQWASGNLVFLLTGMLLGAQAVGGLKACQNILSVLNVILLTATNYIPLHLSKILNNEGLAKFRKELLGIAKSWFVPIFTTIVIISIFSNSILVFVYGISSTHLNLTLTLYSMIYVLIFINTLAQGSLTSLERTKPLAFAFLLSTLVSVAISVMAIPIWGIFGSLTALAAAQIVSVAAILISIKAAGSGGFSRNEEQP